MNMTMNFRLDNSIARRLKELACGRRIISSMIRYAIEEYPSRIRPEMVRLHAREVSNINNMPITEDIDKKITKMSVKWRRSKTTTYNSMIKYMLDNNFINPDEMVG